MKALDRLVKRLTEQDDREHKDFKLFPLMDQATDPEQLAEQVEAALMQMDSGEVKPLSNIPSVPREGRLTISQILGE